MEERIRTRLNDDILAEVWRRYGVTAVDAQLLDGFESFIYEVDGGAGKPFILRLSHSLRRSEALILGEVDWINYLDARGVGVARALPSPGGRLVERVDDGQDGAFLATAFAKAPGESPWTLESWDAPFFSAYGRLLGRLHAASKDYMPSDPAWRRPEWDDPDNLFGLAWIPAEQTAVLARYRAIIDTLQALPKSADSYGLIHQDAHGGNFFVTPDESAAHGLRLTLFDFDDCVYSWFIYDIAMVLFYTLVNRPNPAELGRALWAGFWPAYKAEFDLDEAWLAEIPWFLKFREVDLYGAIYRSLGSGEYEDRWVRAFMDGRRERIELGQPFLDLDFAQMARELDQGGTMS